MDEIAQIPGPMDHKKYRADDALESIAGRAKVNPGASNAKLFGRRERRKLHPVHTGSYHAPKHKTGQPDWFRTMKVQSQIKKILLKVHTESMVLSGVSPMGRASLIEAYPTVWDLSQANREKLLALKGVGPAVLGKVRRELTSRSVPVAWKV